MDRRDFLKTVSVAAAGSVSPASVQGAQSSNWSYRPESPNMIYRELGRTGERVSAIGIGAITLGSSKTPMRASVYFVLQSIAVSPS
jgi:uncharacterized protein